MTPQEIAWTVRAEVLAHDFTEREKDLIEVILLSSLDLGRAEASLTGGFGQWTGRREDEERRICAALARSGVIVFDGTTARLLPDPKGWKIRRKLVGTALVLAQQAEFFQERPLDAALASVSADGLTVSDRISRLRRAIDTTAGPLDHPGEPANSQAPRCEPANSQPSLALAKAKALGLAQAEPKAKLSSELSSESVAVELRRRIGERAWRRYPQWSSLVSSDPSYIAGLIRYLDAVKAETGKDIPSPGGYLSRIIRDDKRWSLVETSHHT